MLETTFEKIDENVSAQRTIFWLGRNYFSYLLEPTIGRMDPIEEKRLDRLLDKMLYRVEDSKWDEFRKFRGQLEQGIVAFFELDQPGQAVK